MKSKQLINAVTGLVCLLLLTGLWACSGSGEQEDGDLTAGSCRSDSDCPSGMACGNDGYCYDPDTDGDELACETHRDCPNGQLCEDYQCVPNEIPDEDVDIEETDGDVEEDGEGAMTDGDKEEEASSQARIQVPAVIFFPPLATGDSHDEDLLIESVGEEDLLITGINATDSSSPDFSPVGLPEFPVQLASGDSLKLTIRYQQSNSGFDNGQILIASNAENSTSGLVNLQVQETGLPKLRCESTSLDFDITDIGSQGRMLDLVCHNDRLNDEDDNLLTISRLELDPDSTPHFKLDESVPNRIVIRSGRSVDISVWYTPAQEGEHSAELQLYHNSSGVESPLAIALTGEGGGKHLSLDPTALHFGQVRIGEEVRQTVALSATGDFPVTIQLIEFEPGTSADFRVYLDGLLDDGSFLLEAGGSETIEVGFNPSQINLQTADLLIVSNAVEGPSQSLTCDGEGTDFDLHTDPAALDFAAVEVGEKALEQVAVVNDGNEAVEVLSLEFETAAGVFGIEGSGAPFLVNPGASQTLTVSFTPDDETAFENALIFNLDHNDFPSISLPLNGEGARPHVEIEPSSRLYDFGEVNLGEVREFDFVVRNTGGIPLTLSDFQWLQAQTGDPNQTLDVQLDGSPDIEPQSSRNLHATFSPPFDGPTGAMPLSAEREYGFSTTDTDNPELSVSVSGIMVDPHVAIDPPGPSYDFGSVLPGFEATPIEVVLTNDGTGTLSVTDIHLTADSDTDAIWLAGLPDSFPVELLPNGTRAGQTQLRFTVHFLPPNLNQFNAMLRIVNEGYTDKNLSISIVGNGSNCSQGLHPCAGECVANEHVDHCGSLCDPCPETDYGYAICSPFLTSYVCDILCDEHFVKVNGQCEPVNTDDCCGVDCLDCTLSHPDNGSGACDEGQCVVDCDQNYHLVEGECLINDTVDCCGLQCLQCPERLNATRVCVAGACDFECIDDFDDCNERASDGCEVHLPSNVNHCNLCDNACTVNNGVPLCDEGVCKVGSCNYGWGNCDEGYENGCEESLLVSEDHCGECGAPCYPDNGIGQCNYGQCTIRACDFGYRDCENGVVDGCETYVESSLDHCGECNNPCAPAHAIPICTGGICGLSGCDEGYRNCDTSIVNGCERNILTDTYNCGNCGIWCQPDNGTGYCNDGTCAVQTCFGSFRDCNEAYSDGCEVDTKTDAEHCGSCFESCLYDHGTGKCFNSSCLLNNCTDPWKNCDESEENGCESNSLSDPANCGNCDVVCPTPPNMYNAGCLNGDCIPGVCVEGYKNCNGDYWTTGCETDIYNDPDSCGDCGEVCELANAITGCSLGECVIESCIDGFEDCNGNPTDGCEINTRDDPDHCDGCNQACNLSHADQHRCVGGVCHVLTCDENWGDCDLTQTNGCEKDLRSDVNNCGVCERECPAVGGQPECTNGLCLTNCGDGYAECDGNLANGCEADLDAVTNTCTGGLTMQRTDGNGSIRGDDGQDVTFTYSEWGEKWFSVNVTEDNASCIYLSVWLVLDVPPGMDYTMEVYRGTCSNHIVSGSGGVGVDETVKYCEDDQWGSDDDFTLYVHVNFGSGNQCAEWSLQAIGNLAVSGCGCTIF